MNSKWQRITILVISFPSTILVGAVLLHKMEERSFISPGMAIGAFVAMIIGMLGLLVTYAYRK